jgi:PTH1 family peptidyl-tRNA hydrolase
LAQSKPDQLDSALKEKKMLPEAEKRVFVVVGLGNPGRDYRNTRHNTGFMVLDRLALRLGVSFSRLESRSLIVKTTYQDNRLVLAKPQTFMNESGRAVGSLVKFYKVPLSNLLVIFDDVDLPFGALRMRSAGGSSGQKGMISIIDRLGSEDFIRLRVGIGRPPGSKDAADYVLKGFSHQESVFLPQLLDRAVDAILTYVTEGLEKAMNLYNGQGLA